MTTPFKSLNAAAFAQLLLSLVLLPLPAMAEPAYTNHAGNAISGWPIKLTATHVVLADLESVNTSTNQPINLSTFQPLDSSTELPLSIFTEQERRRIAADFVLGAGGAGQVNLLRVPVDVKRAVEGAEKSMARSRKRAEKGLCSKEESANFLYQGTGGATLAVDPNSGHLHLQKYNWLDRLDVEKAVKGLTRFADTVNTWKELVTETMASASAASDVPSVPTQSEFMQVRPFAA